jgi:hypothetical protein
MYCPTCGSQNPDELKFCTRCGTNLGVVSDALSGKFDPADLANEKEVKLLTDYYRGRRSTIIGFVAVVISVFKLSVSSLLGNPQSFAWLTPLFIGVAMIGLIWFFWGVAKWNDCGSELKALGYDNPRSAAPKKRRKMESLPEGSTVLAVKGYTTDSLKEEMVTPPSVTESTTRFFEEEEKQPVPRTVAN